MQELSIFLSNHMALTGPLVVVFILLIVVEILRAKQTTVQLSPFEATQKINHDHAEVIDLRPKDQYTAGHIINAHAYPHSPSAAGAAKKLEVKNLEKWRGKPLIFVCQQGLESQKIALRFIKEGFVAYTIKGGMNGWINASMPIIKE